MTLILLFQEEDLASNVLLKFESICGFVILLFGLDPFWISLLISKFAILGTWFSCDFRSSPPIWAILKIDYSYELFSASFACWFKAAFGEKKFYFSSPKIL